MLDLELLGQLDDLCIMLWDMVRYHKFLVARFWVPEYGSSDDPAQFKYIRAYSPYQNVKPGTKFPAVLFISGDGDIMEPDDGILAIGSGGPYALAAARALTRFTGKTAREIAEESLKIAAEICVYTNAAITIEVL